MWESFCSDVSGYLQYIDAEEFEYTVNISLKYKYVYVETAKVACSTIKLILQRMELDDPDYVARDLVDMHSRIYSPLCSPARVGGFPRYLNRDDVTVFCFVRNPYTRVLSCYLDKIRNNMRAKKSVLSALEYDPEDMQRDISFGEFVEAISRQSIGDMDPHWRIQYHQTFQDQIDYDFVGRFESLEDDLKSILGRITPEYVNYWGVENRHATGSSSQILEFYDQNTEEQVYEIYRKDFDTFNYDRLKL